MTTTVSLLLVVIHLLTMVVANPNTPQSLKSAVVDIANRVADQAQQDMNIAPANPVAVISNPTVPVYNLPLYPTQPGNGGTVVGGVINNPTNHMADAQLIVNPDTTFKSADSYKDEANGVPFGTYFYKVSFVNADGVYVKDAPIKFTSPDATEGEEQNRTTDTRMTRDDVEYYHTFSYTPKTAGVKHLVFESDAVIKTVDVTVQ